MNTAMSPLELTILVLEFVGTAAFALSGILAALRKNFDLVGVVLVALAAAFGGGTLRDVLIGRQPFYWVQNEALIWALLLVCVLLPLWLRNRDLSSDSRFLLIADAVGLGIFTAISAGFALEQGFSLLLAASIGALAAIAGGILRDILVNEVPVVFSDHRPYATVAFFGGLAVVASEGMAIIPEAKLLIATGLIVLVRLLAIRFDWRLPRWR
ncbi:MAG: hypothetical protein RL198_356 [Actinomycetota bacterium]